jgi:predicted nucleic acid-binding protein
MMDVLDTNIVGKTMGPKRNPHIDKWLNTVSDSDLFITVFTIQEIDKGIALLRKNGNPDKVHAACEIENACDALILQFADRVLPLDVKSARDWGRRLAKHGTKNGNDLGIIAVIATQHHGVAVTQNLIDFRHRGIPVINPYDDPPAEFNDPET